MERAAALLGIHQTTEIYGLALELNHQLQLKIGSLDKFPANLCHLGILKLAASHFDYRLDLDFVAKQAPTTQKALLACIEYAVSVLPYGSVITVSSICRAIGYPHATLIKAIEDLCPLLAMKPPYQVYLAALVYCCLQALKLTVSVQKISSVAYANGAHVQNCSNLIKSSLKASLEALVQNKTLIKSIKEEGKRNVKLKTIPTSNTTWISMKQTHTKNVSGARVGEQIKAYLTSIEGRNTVEKHYADRIGYASLFCAHPLPTTDSLHKLFNEYQI